MGDLGLIPGLGRSPGEGKDYPLQYSGLENSMDYTVHGVSKSRTRLINLKKKRILWRRKWQPTPLFLPGESHGQGSLEGYSPRGLKESDTSEPLSLPLHGMIFNSKLTVIIKFSLNIKKKKKERKDPV